MDTKKYTFELLKVKPMSGLNKKKSNNRPIAGAAGLLNPTKKKMGGLTGGQKKIDANKDGKISGEDFKLLRKKKMKMGGAFVLTPEQKRKSKVAEKELSEIEKRKMRRDAEQMMSNRNPAQMKMGGVSRAKRLTKKITKRPIPEIKADAAKKGGMMKKGMGRKKARGN